MPQKETAPAADQGGEEVQSFDTASSTESNTQSQSKSPVEDVSGTLDRRLAKVRKQAAPASPKVSWRQVLKVHPAADKVPVASNDEVRALRGDLQKNGLIEPVLLVRIAAGPKQVLDGRTRLGCLEDNGIEVVTAGGELLVKHETIELPDDTAALSLVLSLNLHRRHLSVDARRELAKAILIAAPEMSDRAVSRIVGVSHPTIAKDRKKHEAKGDVETVTTSRDTRGRSQPRKRKSRAAPRVPYSAYQECSPEQLDLMRLEETWESACDPARVEFVKKTAAEIVKAEQSLPAKPKVDATPFGSECDLLIDEIKLKLSEAAFDFSPQDRSELFEHTRQHVANLARKFDDQSPWAAHGLPAPDESEDEETRHCSFCSKSEHEVQHIVTIERHKKVEAKAIDEGVNENDPFFIPPALRREAGGAA